MNIKRNGFANNLIFIIFLIFFFCVQAKSPINAENIHLNHTEDTYTESNARRAEIVFFISLPFTLLAQGLIISGLHYLDKPHEALSISTHVAAFWIGSSIMISGGIAYADYRVNNPLPSDAETSKPSAYMKFTYPFN